MTKNTRPIVATNLATPTNSRNGAALAGYEVDADGVITVPERVAVMRNTVKNEVIETRVEWYSALDGKVRVKMSRVVVKRLAPPPNKRFWRQAKDKNLSLQFAALEKGLAASQSAK